MDLWILSQDKTQLKKADDIIYGRLSGENNKWSIIVNQEVFGYYQNEKRAKEILQEIEKLLIGSIVVFKNIDDNYDIENYLQSKTIMLKTADNCPEVKYLHRDCDVYEMPKD